MSSKWWFRFSVLIFLTIGAGFMITPTVLDLDKKGNFPVKSKINLGLDLQGGLYMILGIDFKKVYKDEVSNMVRKAAEYLDDEGIKASLGEADLTDLDDPLRAIVVDNPVDMETAKEKVSEYYGGRYIRLVNEKDNILTYGMHVSRRTEIENESVQKSIEVIRNRIDEFGVTEPEITSQGTDRIVVQLPGEEDIERAKDLIGKTAKLEFKIVNDEQDYASVASWIADAEKELGIKYEKGKRFSNYLDAINQHLAEKLPKGYILAFEKAFNKKGELTKMLPYLVEAESTLTGDDLQDASVQINQQEQTPYVSLTFKSRGATQFAKITEKSVGKRMAIVLDGNVYSAPVIREKIGGGRASIELGSGPNFQDQMKEASDLSLVLRAGALPVQLNFEEQRIVGPQLGADSINSARRAAIIGCLLVFFFILIYYRVSGFIALVLISLNVLFILACLVGLEATLTLPGIAGIALTVGMAIDASIIIYERIREEIRREAGYYKAVEKGFASAFWTIIDANITTALAGLALINFGTGPIRGFAVTLLIGIFATVYTSYFVGNLIFQLYMNKVEGRELSI